MLLDQLDRALQILIQNLMKAVLEQFEQLFVNVNYFPLELDNFVQLLLSGRLFLPLIPLVNIFLLPLLEFDNRGDLSGDLSCVLSDVIGDVWLLMGQVVFLIIFWKYEPLVDIHGRLRDGLALSSVIGTAIP